MRDEYMTEVLEPYEIIKGKTSAKELKKILTIANFTENSGQSKNITLQKSNRDLCIQLIVIK